jgi:hypothetical protein
MCRERGCIQRDKRKRPALQEIDPNIGPPPAQRHATPISQAPFRPSTINHGRIPPVYPPISPVQPLRPLPTQPPPPVQP